MEEKSSQIQADVFYDATLSMQGFVVPGIATAYARVLDRLEGSITTGWSNTTVNFYRFGTNIRELKEREHKNVVKPFFYNEREIRGVTRIDTVIDEASSEHLTIIVTDLFQDDADVTKLVNKLKDKFLVKDLSVGLLGVQSEFDGIVFDVGINRDWFKYPGQRPFYVLMIGKHRDIEHLYNSLNARILNKLPNTYFVLLSRHFSFPLPAFENAKVISKENIDETTSILPHKSKDPRVKQLRIKSGRPISQMTITLPRMRLPNTLQLNPSAFEMRLLPYKIENISNKDTLVHYTDGIGAVDTAEVVLTDSSLQFQIKVDGKRLVTTGLYVFEQIINLKPNADLLPKWVSEWDMDITKLPHWKQKPTTFEGQTTLNLKKFAFDLWQGIVQTQKPEVAHLFYYIRKE
jgi:hypothetical protein